MEKTTVYLPSALKTALEAEGRRSKRPQARLIREALEGYLAARPRPLPKSIGIVADGSLPAASAKEWVHREWDREWRQRRGRAPKPR